MALISTIREKSWMLIVLIALGMLGFLIMDATGPGGFLGANNDVVGTVNGEKIRIKEFQYRVNQNSNSQDGQDGGFQSIEEAWKQTVDSILLGSELEKCGITIGEEEMKALMGGSEERYLSPFLKEQFTNRETGQFTFNQVASTVAQIEASGDAKQKSALANVRKEVERLAKADKLSAMVTKAIYTPTWMAQNEYKNSNAAMTLAYVQIPYANVSDKEVQVSDEDLKAYIKDHPGEFDKKPSASIEFVTFPVIASSADSANLRNALLAKKASFTESKDDSLFVAQESGETMSKAYLTKDKMVNNPMADTMFSVALGTVVGPYVNSGMYSLSKVVDRKAIPDSIKARHILREIKTQEEFTREKALIDSLKTEIEAGRMSFAQAADSLGTDGTKGKGGDLGFFAQGQMVEQFNDYCFFEAQPGKLGIVFTRFGIHLIEVTGSKGDGKMGVKLATIGTPIQPSKASRDKANQDALNFIANNNTLEAFRKAAESKRMRVEKAESLGLGAFALPGLGPQNESRQVVRWAFNEENNVGAVAKRPFAFENDQFKHVDKYVAVALSSRKGEGMPAVADVAEQVRTKVLNLKKAEAIKAKTAGKDLSSIAAAYSVRVDTATDVRAAIPYSALGQEKKVLGAALKLKNGQTSTAIDGRAGVFVVSLLNRSEAPESDPKTARASVGRMMQASAGRRMMDALRDAADIKDKRMELNY